MNSLINKNQNSIALAAQELYEKGFNVMPLYWPSKRARGSWKVLKTTRLPVTSLDCLFRDTNVGVLTGKTSMNLFVLDCDSSESFNWWAEKLHSRGLDRWIVGSANGGHFWFLSKDGEVERTFVKRAKKIAPEDNYQIWGHDHYMVAPPSIRRDKTYPSFEYYWMCKEGELPPQLCAQDIEDIFPNVHVCRPLVDGMTSLAHQVIVKHELVGYPSHSEAEFASIISLLRIGWTGEEITALFDQYLPPHYAKEGKDNLWFERFMLNPAKKILHPKGDAIGRAVEWANQNTWGKRTFDTDKTVFLACCERAKRQSPYRFRATVREIAQDCSMSKTTASKSLKRLRENDFLVFCSDSKHGEAKPKSKMKETAYYSIPQNILGWNSEERNTCTVNVPLSEDIKGHDAWHRSALGKNALSIYEFLFSHRTRKGKTLVEIARVIKKSPKTILSGILRLEANGLVWREEDRLGVKTVDQAHLDKIAMEHGTLGANHERQDAFKRQRASYAFYVIYKSGRFSEHLLVEEEINSCDFVEISYV